MKHIKISGQIILLLILVACVPTTDKKNQIEIINGWNILNESNYLIQYPVDWDLNKSGLMGTSFILLSKQSIEKDQFKENVNLLIQDLTGQNINLDKFVKISEGQIKTMITNGNILESKKLHANGIDFQRLVYTGTQGIFNLKFEQYYLVEKEKAFVLTLTCETNEFEKYREIGEKIMNSFRLK